MVAASVSDSKSCSCNEDGEVEESGEGTLSLSVDILPIFMLWRVGNDDTDSVDNSLFLILSIPISSYSSPPPSAATTNYVFIAALNVNNVIIMDITVMDEKVLLLLFLFSFSFFILIQKSLVNIHACRNDTLQSLLFVAFHYDFPTSH